MAVRNSTAVRGSRSANTSITGRGKCPKDTPKLPVKVFFMWTRYCCHSGLSSPKDSLICALTSAGRSGFSA